MIAFLRRGREGERIRERRNEEDDDDMSLNLILVVRATRANMNNEHFAGGEGNVGYGDRVDFKLTTTLYTTPPWVNGK